MLAFSQSSTDMLPSGRSAMIWIVVPLSRRDLDPHEAETEIAQRRRDDMGDPTGEAGLGHETRLVELFRCHAGSRGKSLGAGWPAIRRSWFPRFVKPRSANKKERVPVGPTLKMRSSKRSL